jgi:ParB family chromosome partitioning protein
MKFIEINKYIAQNIDLAQINEPELPMRIKTSDSKIDVLVDSIKRIGLINPLTVSKSGDRYNLIAGFRRYLALQQLGTKVVSVMIIPADNDLILSVMTAENYEREDVNIIDESIYFRKCIHDLKITQKHLAKTINRTESYVSERLAILNYDPDLQNALALGKISFSVCRELNKIDDIGTRMQYTRYAIENGCTPEIARKWRMELKSTEQIEAATLLEQASENYNQKTGQVVVSMPCKICNANTDVNELITMHVCPLCAVEIKKALN